MVFGKKKPAILIPSAGTPPVAEALATSELQESFSERQENLFIEKLTDQLKYEREAHNDRRKFSRWIFGLALGWLLLVLAIVVFNGFGLWSFNLSDQVLIALLTTTTANIIGTLVIVLNYLFPKPK